MILWSAKNIQAFRYGLRLKKLGSIEVEIEKDNTHRISFAGSSSFFSTNVKLFFFFVVRQKKLYFLQRKSVGIDKQ